MPVPVDLSKLSDVVKKTKYDELVAKVNDIDTSRFVLKTKNDADISELKNKIPDTSSLVKKTDYNIKIAEIEDKIPNVTNLATKTALTTVENKIADFSSLVKKTGYNTRVAEIDTKVSNLDGKIAENKTKNESIENELNRSLNNFGHVLLVNMFFDGRDSSQAYLIFQPLHRHAKPPPTSDNSLTPLIDYYSCNIRVKFNGSILRQPKVSYTHEEIVNIYIVFELAGSSSHSHDPRLKKYLFGAITLTKNADIYKYGYSGYGIGFDRKSSFSFPGGGFGQNVLIFGTEMSTSVHIDNNKKDISVLVKGPTQGLEHTLTAEKMYSINFTVTKKKFCLSLHYNGADSYLFVNGKEIVKFKTKAPLCLGNISKDWSVSNMQKLD